MKLAYLTFTYSTVHTLRLNVTYTPFTESRFRGSNSKQMLFMRASTEPLFCLISFTMFSTPKSLCALEKRLGWSGMTTEPAGTCRQRTLHSQGNPCSMKAQDRNIRKQEKKPAQPNIKVVHILRRASVLRTFVIRDGTEKYKVEQRIRNARCQYVGMGVWRAGSSDHNLAL
ncbi:hypothetical protein Mapa_006769 [Marchantia paleacea]|nr:hypothetical protein Mapa_006769 [Marchantia paleacea]